MLESQFKKKIQTEMKKGGWVFIQLVAGTVPVGFPDTLCLSPTGEHFFVEWKKSKNAKKQPLQDYWNNKLNDMGHDAWFVYPENIEEWRVHVQTVSDARRLSS